MGRPSSISARARATQSFRQVTILVFWENSSSIYREAYREDKGDSYFSNMVVSPFYLLIMLSRSGPTDT